MARYYDLDKLSKLIEARADTMLEGKCAMLYVAKWLNLLPTADVVEVVRCNDCKHWHKKAFDPIVEHDIGECHCAHWENDYFSYETLDNDFCSYGKRRDI